MSQIAHTIGWRICSSVCLFSFACITQTASAYVPADRWVTTASGSAGFEGDNVTLTWSLARDGTSIPSEGDSNLIGTFDDIFNYTDGGTNFATRPWFGLFQQSFDRWEALSGINFVYEPNDSNTAALSGLRGLLGVRGDIRIGGQNIDGSGSTLAYASYPDNGDIVLDTSEVSYFSSQSNNHRAFRDTLMHEIGHAFGLDHVSSTSDRLLMEPTINTAFDGPQLDDIRGVQGLYGDALEKTNSGLGNNTAALAYSLGPLTLGGSLSLGSQAAGSQSVASSETDFVSIANSNDVDFYSFTVSSPAELDITLTPWGGTFNQNGLTFDATARNNLSVAVFGANGTTLLGSAATAAVGQIEALMNVELANAGQYFVRVMGADDNVQLYQLQLSAAAPTPVLDGDYNLDGIVNAADYVLWRKTVNQTGSNLLADGDNNNVIDDLDYAMWRTNFGETFAAGAAGFENDVVPEPGKMMMTVMASGLIFCMRFAFVRFGRRSA